jgi:hypothetical protein
MEGIEQKMMSEFPVIRESGWRILRPVNQNSTDLIPFMAEEPKNGKILRR